MFLLLVAICALFFAAWAILQARYGNIARGDEPLVITRRTDLPFEDLNAFRKNAERRFFLGLPCIHDEPQKDLIRFRVFEDPGHKTLVSEVLYERLRETGDSEVVRMVRHDKDDYPLGEDHYLAELCFQEDGQSVIMVEERGQFGSPLKVAMQALGVRRYLRDLVKGKYDLRRTKRGPGASMAVANSTAGGNTHALRL